MRIEGDIKVWVDGEKACARLTADGPEGPIVIHASAPLAPIRKLVARQFAERGITVSGEDPAFNSSVKRIARRKALRRLKRIAPSAFQRGGLGPYLATQELRRRRRRRRALGQAGQPVGAKPLGPLPRRRRRRRHLLLWQQRRLLAAKATQGPALLPAMPGPTSATALTIAMPGGQAIAPSGGGGGGGGGGSGGGGGGSGGGGGDSGPPPAAPDEPTAAEEQESPDEQQEGIEEETTEEATDDGAEATEDTSEASSESSDSQEARDGEEEVSGDSADERQEIARARLRAAIRLLAMARQNPRARQKIEAIATLAGEGNPTARKAMATLSKAHKIRKARAARGRAILKRGKTLTRPVFKGRPLLAPPVAPPPPPVPSRPPPAAPPPAGVSSVPRWWDFLAHWRRGIG